MIISALTARTRSDHAAPRSWQALERGRLSAYGSVSMGVLAPVYTPAPFAVGSSTRASESFLQCKRLFAVKQKPALPFAPRRRSQAPTAQTRGHFAQGCVRRGTDTRLC